MGNLDKYFNDASTLPSHPKLRAWGPLLVANPGRSECEIVRKREGFGFQPARLYLHVQQAESGQPLTEEAGWDETLNNYLLEHGVRATTEENEALRFHLTLRDSLQKVEARYGEGYFNAVLLEVLKSGFEFDPAIQRILEQTGPGNPSHGRAYSDAVAMVEGAVRECARLLLERLKYPREAGENILSKALGVYLEERFSIYPAAMLGLR